MVFRKIYCIQVQSCQCNLCTCSHIHLSIDTYHIDQHYTWPRHIGVVLHDIPCIIESMWTFPHGRWHDNITACFPFLPYVYMYSICVLLWTSQLVKRAKGFGCLNGSPWRSWSNVYPGCLRWEFPRSHVRYDVWLYINLAVAEMIGVPSDLRGECELVRVD
jgi:hypothetical protein